MFRFGFCIIFLVFFFVANAFSSDAEYQLPCKMVRVHVSPAIMHGGEQVLQDFLVTIEKQSITKEFKYSAQNDFLKIKCETKQDGTPVLLVNHFCGGSGCAESNYSIIDLTTFEVLLNADERYLGNHAKAESILGKDIGPIICDINSICCSATFK